MPEAPVVTSTATSSAQGTPKAEAVEPKIPTPVTSQAAPAPVVTPPKAPEPLKVETKVEPAKPATEPAKEAVKADAEVAKPAAEAAKTEPAKEVVYDIPLLEGAAITKEEIEVVKAFSKEQGYSNDQAYAVAAYLDQVKLQNKALTDDAWVKECQSNPKYGKEKYGQTSENIKRYLERVAPKLIPLLESTRYGNHPEVFDYFAEQASRGADDTLVAANQAVEQDNRSTLKKMEDEFNASLKK